VRIAVVIVNFNGREYIADCLRSVRRSTRQPALVLVFDNASADESADLVARDFPEVELVRSVVNTGFTGGVNKGMERALDAGCDAILLLNPDATLTPSALDRLAEAAVRHPGAVLSPGIVLADRPQVVDSYVGRVVWHRGRSSAPYLGASAPGGPSHDEPTETASGCCLYIPATVARSVGPLDEAYFLYFEDMDFLERARQNGHEIWYVPSAIVEHREGAATGGRASPLALYYYVRNRHYFVRKFKRGRPVYAAFLAFSTAHVAARASMSLLRGQIELSRAIVRGAIDGWRRTTGRSY